MPTERPPLVGEVVPFLRIEGDAWSAQRIPPGVCLGFLGLNRYYFFQVAPQLSSHMHENISHNFKYKLLSSQHGFTKSKSTFKFGQ
jgi:hypothetical protein